jgi:hypothetical protein
VIGTLGGLDLALRELSLPLKLGTGVAACQRSFAAAAHVAPSDGAARDAAAGPGVAPGAPVAGVDGAR